MKQKDHVCRHQIASIRSLVHTRNIGHSVVTIEEVVPDVSG